MASRSRRRVMHFATLASDNSACGVDIRPGGWTPTLERVTCNRCRFLIPKAASARRVERLAVAMWDEERSAGDGSRGQPSVSAYADGLNELMPFYEQSLALRNYWRKKAIHTIDLVKSTEPSSEGRDA